MNMSITMLQVVCAVTLVGLLYDIKVTADDERCPKVINDRRKARKLPRGELTRRTCENNYDCCKGCECRNGHYWLLRKAVVKSRWSNGYCMLPKGSTDNECTIPYEDNEIPEGIVRKAIGAAIGSTGKALGSMSRRFTGKVPE